MDRSRLIQQTAPTTQRSIGSHHRYQVDGDSGTSDVQSFDITVLGTNDAIHQADVLDASGNPLAPQEGDALIAGQLSSSDLDTSHRLLLTHRRCHPRTINSDGSWSFNPADSAYNDLSEGELKTITVDTDDQNAVDTGHLAPAQTTTQRPPLSVLEGATDSSGNTLNLTGQLTATDIDSVRLA